MNKELENILRDWREEALQQFLYQSILVEKDVLSPMCRSAMDESYTTYMNAVLDIVRENKGDMLGNITYQFFIDRYNKNKHL